MAVQFVLSDYVNGALDRAVYDKLEGRIMADTSRS